MALSKILMLSTALQNFPLIPGLRSQILPLERLAIFLYLLPEPKQDIPTSTSHLLPSNLPYKS